MRVLGMSSRMKTDKETWWWNEEVPEYVRERLAQKKWDTERTEESRWEYRKMQKKVKIQVEKGE